MRITILNGEPNPGSAFQVYLHSVAAALRGKGREVQVFELDAMNLCGCSGCFGCWVKTPGECVKRDESATICRAAIQSDLLVLASPMILGTTSALLKRAIDQMVPILHPYITIEGGEMHHRARYARYPLMALLLGEGGDLEDLEITKTMWTRAARNFKSKLVGAMRSERPAQEVADALAAVA